MSHVLLSLSVAALIPMVPSASIFDFAWGEAACVRFCLLCCGCGSLCCCSILQSVQQHYLCRALHFHFDRVIKGEPCFQGVERAWGRESTVTCYLHMSR